MIRIGTRGSRRALAQARAVAAHVSEVGEETSIVPQIVATDARAETLKVRPR
jgi:porphobilinogen deaminase